MPWLPSWASENYVAVPTWIITLLFAAAVAIPWIHWQRRFSLRTLLAATTLLAVVLGLAVWAAKK